MAPEVNERARILRMVEEGKVSAEEAARLLDALDEQTGRAAPKNRQIRVAVTSKGRSPVNVTVPIELARTVLRFVPKGNVSDELDPQAIMRLIESGASGKILDVDHDGHHVEIFVE